MKEPLFKKKKRTSMACGTSFSQDISSDDDVKPPVGKKARITSSSSSSSGEDFIVKKFKKPRMVQKGVTLANYILMQL